jgi:cytochrome c oxidase cbb3-type subunit III
LSSRCLELLAALAPALVLGGTMAVGCDREYRESRPPMEEASLAARPVRRHPYQGNAYGMAEGKRLFVWFNCTGCHANGGGAIGPALMDARWRYGAEPQELYTSIVAGRPNGMPGFRGKIPDHQVWQLVAYVRSLAGLAPMDAAPSRNDNMSVHRPENLLEPRPPVREEASQPR